jgi:hypothetical protein
MLWGIWNCFYHVEGLSVERVMLITLLSDEMLGITPLMLKNQFILLLKSEGLILANPIPLQSLDLLESTWNSCYQLVNG